MKLLQRFKIAVLSLLSILLLSACSDTLLLQGAPLSAANADFLAELSSDRNNYLLAMMASPGDPTVRLLAAEQEHLPAPAANLLAQFGIHTKASPHTSDITVGCVTLSGDNTDNDGDEIPINVTISVDCVVEEGADAGNTLKGSMTVIDKNDGDPESGYSITIPSLIATEITIAGENRLELSESFDLAVAGSSYDIAYAMTLNASGVAGSGSFSEDSKLSYRPDNLADPFIAGTFTSNNNVSFSEGSESYSLNERSNPSLHYDESCESGFDQGGVIYEDSLGNTVSITYHACDDVSVRFTKA